MSKLLVHKMNPSSGVRKKKCTESSQVNLASPKSTRLMLLAARSLPCLLIAL
jgi:hypothetical protein